MTTSFLKIKSEMKKEIKYTYVEGFDDYQPEFIQKVNNSKILDKNTVDYTRLVAQFCSRK